MTKIKSTFQSPSKVAESITSMRLSVLLEPTLTASTKVDAYEKALEKDVGNKVEDHGSKNIGRKLG